MPNELRSEASEVAGSLRRRMYGYDPPSPFAVLVAITSCGLGGIVAWHVKNAVTGLLGWIAAFATFWIAALAVSLVTGVLVSAVFLLLRRITRGRRG